MKGPPCSHNVFTGDETEEPGACLKGHFADSNPKFLKVPALIKSSVSGLFWYNLGTAGEIVTLKDVF